jgi:acetyltransferase-like isoleucine patch superfamily enzyme
MTSGEMTLGARCEIVSRPVRSHFVCDTGAVLAIGDDVRIGHGAAIAAFERVEIGAGTCIGPFVIIMDTNFHGAPGDQTVRHDCRPVIIGRNCLIGSRVTITRGATIGDGARVLAGSVVSSAIGPGVCAGGARARALGQAGYRCGWDSPVALLPLLLMDALEAAVPLENDVAPGTIAEFTQARRTRFLTAIRDHFGVRLDQHDIRALPLASIAALVDARRAEIDMPDGQ